MTALQQKNAKKVKNISIEMQRNRFETYSGRLRFKPNYRLCTVKGSIAPWYINPFPNKPWNLDVCNTSLLKTLGIGEIAPNKPFPNDKF